MAKISIVLNVDSRPGMNEESSSAKEMMKGIRTLDFFLEGAKNRINFFRGHEVDLTLYIDQHLPIPQDIVSGLLDQMDNGCISSVIFSKHREGFKNSIYFPKWNDLNYLNALIMPRGEYVVHFDGDTVGFINDLSVIDEWIKWLDEGKYDYISYPSRWSPRATGDVSFNDYQWASTRFFITKKDTIDYTEVLKCLCDSNYLYGKYGDKQRRCPWLEHVLGIIAGNGRVFYPPWEMHKYMIFSWSSYQKGILQELNAMSYNEIVAFVQSRGGISYPNDVSC